jgi:transcriptional regulator with XRE-family HTH domain
MKTFSQKVREARTLLKLSQEKLGILTGVSMRTIITYETTDTRPRPSTVRRLAEALQVSADYLDNDDIDDPMYGIEKKEYVEETRSRYGNKAAKEMDFLLERNAALFAGGSIEQDAKDAFFEALMRAYLTCKEEARKTYGRKKK